jgi:hypothetical protein
MHFRLALACLAAVSCAHPPPSPYFGDERFLRFGVDPDQEANAVIQDQHDRGYNVAQRIVGQYFTALGFMERDGRSVAVRVVTARGIALALDRNSPNPLAAPTTYALLSSPLKDTQDADGDGFEEVFVERRTAAGNCIDVYRVRDVGFVDPVKLDTRHFGQEFCPYAVLDLDGDGKVELLADVSLQGFEPLAPHVRVPLWARDHRFVTDGNSPAAMQFAVTERNDRVQQLVAARKRRDAKEALRLGVELAALAQLSGSEPAEQVAEFDRATRGFVLSPAEAASLIGARNRIFQDWNIEAASPTATPADTQRARHE